MSYSIQYKPVGSKNYPTHLKKPVNKAAIFAFVAVAMLVVLLNIKSIREQAYQLLLPGDPQITKAGLTQLFCDVRSGEPVAEAFTDFCIYIVNNG